jgi:hypothetical protein
MATEKARHFTFLLYLDSIPEDWKMKLELLGVPIAISPLHDKDKSTVEGQEFKKPHYHGIYVAKNPVTAESVRLKIKRAFDNGKAVAQVQIIQKGIEATYLYLTHESKDAIEKKKHVYPKEEIMHLNGFDIDRYVTLDVEQKDAILDLVCDVIDEYELANIRSLRRFLKQHGAEVGLPSIKVVNEVIRYHTGLIRLYFDGVYQEKKHGRIDQKVNEVTGELMNSWDDPFELPMSEEEKKEILEEEEY